MESWGWNTLYDSKSLRSVRLDSVLDNKMCDGSSCQLESPGLALFLRVQEEVLSIPCLCSLHFLQYRPFINLGNAGSPLENTSHLIQATVVSRAEKNAANALSPPGSACQGLHFHSDTALMSVCSEGQNLPVPTSWARWGSSLFRNCVSWFERHCSGGRYISTWRNVP